MYRSEIIEVKPRLQAVRQRALKALEASSTKNANLSGSNSKILEAEFGRTDVDNGSNNFLKCQKSINASDLIAENTIVIDSPLKSLQTDEKCSHNKISFRPSEITGRSTIFKQSSTSNKLDLTVQDILASSFCNNIRRMTLDNQKYAESTSLNSLKTIDISENSKINESFQPAECMTSQLLRDELSWENGFLAMPSSEAIAQDIKKNKIQVENTVNQSAKSSIDFSNISEVGNYFYKRSDQIESIISSNILSPPKRNPVRLVDDDGSFGNIRNSNYTSNLIKIDSQIPVNKTNSERSKLMIDDHSRVLTMTAVEKVLNQLNLEDLLNEQNKLHKKEYTFKKAIIDDNEDPDKENISVLKDNLNDNDTVTFTESLLDDLITDDNNLNHTISMEKDFDDSRFSSLCAVRSAKSPSKLCNIFSDENTTNNHLSKKRLNLRNDSLTQEHLPVTKSFSSTLLNEKKINNFLNVGDHMRPPVSPIRSKSVTPKKQQKTLSPIPSLLSSPQACSIITTDSMRSPIFLDTTTQSDSNYLYLHKDKKSNLHSPIIQSKTKSKSPTIALGVVNHQHTVGSLASAKSRCNSQCSTSSEFTHRVGQSLPIKSTVNQCSFGSLKLRTIAKKTIGIRNVSIKKLSFKVVIEGPGFQIDNMENNSIITLQGQECRTILISFCPTVLGAATGKLNFGSPYDGWPVDKVILLQGYGGHASIKVRDFLKGPIGLPFINMGEVHELSQPLIKTFSIYNRGPLSGFAIINLNSTGLRISNLSERIEIEPEKAYLPPQSFAKFRIIFRPRRSDIKKILSKISDVMTIANIRIITGDEPTRQRIRNIIKVIKETSSDENSIIPELTQSKLSKCWSILSDEIMLNEVKSFVENSENALDLANYLRDWEASITINHCLMDLTKNTSNIIFPDLDETILFRTMICATSSDTKNSKNSVDGDGNQEDRMVESWTVRPNVLQFDQNDIEKKRKFTIRSFFKTEEYFEITSNYKNLFKINPKEGQILAGESIEIEVILLQYGLPGDNVNIIIYFEHEKINVPVILKEEI